MPLPSPSLLKEHISLRSALKRGLFWGGNLSWNRSTISYVDARPSTDAWRENDAVKERENVGFKLKRRTEIHF